MNFRFVFRMGGGSYDCVCCKNTLIVFIAGAEISAFGEITICRCEGTKRKCLFFVARNGKFKCIVVSIAGDT
jgi:hypothetical protein